jgi:hypothetical protein
MKRILLSVISFFIFWAGLIFLGDIDIFVATGFIVILLVHELGHVFALHKLGIRINGLYFLPFLGAITVGEQYLHTENNYAYFKYLGPLVGTFFVLLILLAYFLVKDSRLLYLVYAGGLLNLINMIPISVLDGCGILRGVFKHVEWIGFFILIIAGFFLLHYYVFTLFLLVIFTLFSVMPTQDGYGFRIHEIIIASLLLVAMIILTVRETEFLIWNVPLVLFVVYLFIVYLKDTIFDKKIFDKKSEEMMYLDPLNKNQKISWLIKWVSLSTVLIFLVVYSYNTY